MPATGEFTDGTVKIRFRTITKDDGRYLIFYTFEGLQELDRKEGLHTRPESSGDTPAKTENV